MRVTISIYGRFHAFFLAKQLQRRDYLRLLITSYPKYFTKRYGIAEKNIQSLLIHEAIGRLWRKLPQALHRNFNPNFLMRDWYDRQAAKIIPSDTEIFLGRTNTSLRSLRRAKEIGAQAILHKGSSHYLLQKMLMEEEFETWGHSHRVNDPRTLEKHFQEIEEADFVSIPSRFVMKSFTDQGFPKEKLICIPYGVDLERFRPVQKEDETFRIIFCGNASLQKGTPYLFKAFEELNLKDAELWLVGTVKPEIRRLLKKMDTSRIFHKGPFNEFQLFKYYSQGSVFCLPSIQDGFGVVITQAMACGLPVITTTNTGGPDVVRNERDGFIVPIRDVAALKEKILFLYENPGVQKEMGDSALARVTNNFTWDHYGEKTVKAYKRILENK